MTFSVPEGSYIPVCSEHGICIYHDKHDSYFCSECDSWSETERRCSDNSCQFCIERPDKPSRAPDWNLDEEE